WLHWLGTSGPEFLWALPFLKATHGYPADTAGVAGILYAEGSGIAAGAAIPALDAIDLAPTVCRLLGIDAAPGIDGAVATALLGTSSKRDRETPSRSCASKSARPGRDCVLLLQKTPAAR